jgi:hypothetical protein
LARLLWTQSQDVVPRPRVRHALAYDAARRRTTAINVPPGSVSAGDYPVEAQLGAQTVAATLHVL